MQNSIIASFLALTAVSGAVVVSQPALAGKVYVPTNR